MPYDISVFISHSWQYPSHYETLADWIFYQNWNSGGVPIHFHDWSVPKDDPIHNARNDQELRNAIYYRIQNSNVVVIPTGVYSTYSKWIGKEIEGADYYGKPILAVNPWGQERKSSVVQQSAKETVGWSKKSVVDGIWGLR